MHAFHDRWSIVICRISCEAAVELFKLSDEIRFLKVALVSAEPIQSTAAAIPTKLKVDYSRQWARRGQKSARMEQRDKASDEIITLAKSKVIYYDEKMALKRRQHEMFVKEHEKRMQVLELEEKYYQAKLRKFTEE